MSTRSGPVLVLVHDAFADASGFGGVIRELPTAGHTVVAPPNPLRSSAFDAAALSAFVKAINGPVVLVGHSYRGAVITQASAGLDNVTGLVYVAAFGLDEGESCATVQQPFPPSLLASTIEYAGLPVYYRMMRGMKQWPLPRGSSRSLRRDAPITMTDTI